jgi:arylsulfatase
MWCSTTPVPNDNKGKYGRRQGESAIYNKAAMEVIAKHPEILVNDLHTFISESREFDEWRKQNDVHFWKQELATLVGNKVADRIKAALPEPKQHTAARPNIVLIMSDDMGYSDLGCYGSEVNTPNLDQLAAEGLRYTHFYNTGRCCPTRASLMTGLYAHQAGIGEMIGDGGQRGYRGDLSQNAVTIAEVMKTAGYRTYMSGKWHVAKDLAPNGPTYNWPRQRGYDRFYGTIIGAGSFFDPWTLTRDNTAITPDNDPLYQPETFYYTDAISDNAVMFVKDHARTTPDQPFFMYVAYTAAHWPMHALPQDIAKYKGKYDAGYDAIREARFKRMKELGVIEDWELSPAPETWEDIPEDRRAWELRCMEVYAAMIDNMDQGIGRLVQSLKETGQYENTLIFFLQDNGGCAESRGRSPRKKPVEARKPYEKDELQTMMDPTHARSGEPSMSGPDYMPGPATTYIAYGRNWANVSNTPFREYKSRNHEGGISTPLIAHWPKGIHAKNELRHQPGHLIDIMATCVDLAGAHYPETYQGHEILPMEGESLAGTFDSTETHERTLIWEHYNNAAIRQGKWKLVRLSGKPAAMADPDHWELYNIEEDRSEMHDLSDKMPEKARELRELWEAHAERTYIFPKPDRKRR